VISALTERFDKYPPNTASIPPNSPSPTSHMEHTIPVHTSTPYQHPYARHSDQTRQHPVQEHPRRDDEWQTLDTNPHWLPPRTELNKFDGTDLVDWLEDCEYFFLSTIHQNFIKFKLSFLSLRTMLENGTNTLNYQILTPLGCNLKKN
jgi:hypothetical protein